MPNTPWTKRAAALALELGIVALAAMLGAAGAMRVRVIPKALLLLPEISFGPEDLRVMTLSTLLACLIAFLIARLALGWQPFASPRRAAAEVYALVAGVVAASLYQFFRTTVNFSPEWLAQTTLWGVLLLLVAYALFGRCDRTAPARLTSSAGALFGILNRPAAWAVIAFALTPIIVGKKFTNDRDFANWVTRMRVEANVRNDQPFVLVNALNDRTFTQPIMVQFARSDPRTIYVLTRLGELWRADYPTGNNARLLVDLKSDVGYVEMENGALGFDLHPEFGRAGSPNAGYAYIYYTAWRKDAQTNKLVRIDLRPETPAARLATLTPLIEQGRDNDGYHNAGMVAFGPDSMLYLSVGEATAEQCHQRIDCSLVGGIFRLDVDNRGGTVSRPILRQPENGRTEGYMIPLDNPFADRGASALGEFWALGLRNPFRFAFDPATGAMMAGEVGSTEWEEVNRIERGGNYQFPYIEGYTPQKREKRPAVIVGREMPPVLTYKHTALLRSVIGGTFYRGDKLPALKGKYIFADNYSGEMFAIPANATRVTEWETVARERDVAQRGLTAMVAAPDGELLVPVMGDNDKPTGVIARLVPAGSAAARDDAEAREAEEMRLAAARRGNPALAAVAITPAQARTLFNVNCARCHGAEGRGNGPDQKELGQYIPNFHDENYHKWRSDAAIVAVLNGGGTALGRSELMPPWKDVLRPEEIAALKDYVRSFRGQP